LSDKRDIEGVHVVVSVDGWFVGKRVFGLVISTIQYSSDFSRCDSSVVVLKIFEILRDPAAIDKNANLFSLFIQVSVERSNDFDSLLSIAEFLNLNLFAVIENASNLDLLE
jgi:hypothetical protein